jgi:hypothetical protein
MRLRRLDRAVRLTAGLILCLLGAARGGETTQYFPADKPPSAMETQWRVVWGVEPNDGDSEVLYVRKAYFKRGPDEPEIQVLGDCRISEIFVAYNGGHRYFDISGSHGTLVDLGKHALGPVCLAPGRIYGRDGTETTEGPVIAEVHDDQARWISDQNRVRRGQNLSLWATLGGSSYRYIMLFEFRDDGLVGLRLGATAQNLFSTEADWATHVHTACWRINLALDDASETRVSKVWLDPKLSRTEVKPLRKESRIRWRPEQYTRLRVESLKETNGHDPPHLISYELIPYRYGLGRYHGPSEAFTLHDFWVTRFNKNELRFVDLPSYEDRQSLKGRPATLWYQTPVLHKPQDENFGVKGTNPYQGLSITNWAGVELKPRDFFRRTPLYHP